MKRFWVIGLFFFSLAVSSAFGEGKFYVIVNSANPLSSIEGGELSKIYMKKTSQWPNGQQILPVDQAEGSSVRESFSREVHGKSASDIKAYWEQRIFSGRGTPPLEKGSDGEVISYIKANPNAVGYVSSPVSEPNVKVLKVN